MAYTVTVRCPATQPGGLSARRLRGLSPGQAAQAVLEVREGCPDWQVQVDQHLGQPRGGGR